MTHATAAKPIVEMTRVLIKLAGNQEGQNLTVFDKGGWLKRTYFGVNILQAGADFGAKAAIDARLGGNFDGSPAVGYAQPEVKGSKYFNSLRGRAFFASVALPVHGQKTTRSNIA